MAEKKYRVLCVDDDEEILKIIRMMIEAIGHNVVAHHDSIEALKLFQDLPEQFDLVLTDYNMPNLNGAELCKKVRQTRPEIPIILFTGYMSSFKKETGEGACFNEVAIKPLMMKDLAKLINKVLDVP